MSHLSLLSTCCHSYHHYVFDMIKSCQANNSNSAMNLSQKLNKFDIFSLFSNNKLIKASKIGLTANV